MTKLEIAILNAIEGFEEGTTHAADMALLRRLGILDSRGLTGFGEVLRDTLIARQPSADDTASDPV
jgi:hypothetical protein